MNQQLTRHIITLLLATASLTSIASTVTYNYEGRITGISNSSAFGGVDVGSYFSGSISYDISTLPTSTTGWWSASYALNTSSASVTANISNGLSLTNSIVSATVTNGPAYPVVQYDSFNLNSAYTDPMVVRNGGSSSSIALSFNPTGNTGPLSSTKLPDTLSLDTFPFSGGSISFVSGSAPASGYLYAIQRNSYMGLGMGSVTCYGCYGGVASIPFDNGNTDYQRYVSWLSDGNQPMYVDNLSFQITTLTAAVPEPESYAMLIAGLGLLSVVVRRRKETKKTA